MSKFIKFYAPTFKYQKRHDKSFKNKELSIKNTTVYFGDYGITSFRKTYFTPKQIEALLFFIRKKIKGVGEVRFRSLPLRSITKKKAGFRMGKGKGPVSYWVFCARAGSIIFEIATSLPHDEFFKSFLSFRQMFPVRVNLIVSQELHLLQYKNIE